MPSQPQGDDEERADAPPPAEAADIDAQVAANIRQFRDDLGWSQADLSEKMRTAGWPYWPQTVHRNEAGQRKMSIGELVALAGILGTSVTRLMQPDIEHNTVAWFDQFTGRANASYEDIAGATRALLFARDHLERGIESAERRGLGTRERVRDAIAEARAVLEHGTPERAVETGREDYARDYEADGDES